jgi:hypothetical protein
MLPATLGTASIDVVDRVLVKSVVVIDVDVGVVPVAITPVVVRPDAAYGNSGSPSQSRSRLISGIGVRIVRILRGRCAINYRRIIGRNVS